MNRTIAFTTKAVEVINKCMEAQDISFNKAVNYLIETHRNIKSLTVLQENNKLLKEIHELLTTHNVSTEGIGMIEAKEINIKIK